LAKVKKKSLKYREKRRQRGDEERRKRNRSEDGRLMRRRRRMRAVGKTNVLYAGQRLINELIINYLII